MPFTLYPCAALSDDGYFIPAIKVADSKGNHLRTYRPEGAAAEFRTFTNSRAALTDAWAIARRIAVARPAFFHV